MGYFENKAKKIVLDYTISHFELKKNITAGVCRYNYRCFRNAVHDAWTDKQKQIGIFMCEADGWPYIHFCNYDGKKFIDNTLGEWHRENKYYLIRLINEEEFANIYDIFDKSIKFYMSIIPWYIRMFTSFTV